jgi:hypothetical protein
MEKQSLLHRPSPPATLCVAVRAGLPPCHPRLPAVATPLPAGSSVSTASSCFLARLVGGHAPCGVSRG